MKKTEKAIITVLCMIYSDDKILLQNRIKKDWKGVTFPGGHVEKNESFVNAVIREMKEETGLDIKNPRICGIKQFQTEEDERYIVVLFKTSEFGGTLTSSSEGEMIWIRREELGNYEVVKDFMELLRVFDQKDLNEFMYERNGDEWLVKLY